MTNVKDKETLAFQDRCLALRPLIGTQADQFWQCYLFQDEEGKEELEQQLDLLVNSRLNTDVLNRTPVFLPPSASTAAGTLPVGKVHYNARDTHPFALREDDLMHHIGIFGATGTGKTNTAHLLVT